MNTIIKLGAPLVLALGFAACDDVETTPAAADMGVAGPTWHQDIAPLLHRNCVGCHQAGGIGQFPLETYAQAAPLASTIVGAVQSGRMPPWGAQETEDCSPRHGFKDDISLSDADKAQLEAWAMANAPEGDAATAAALPQRVVSALEDIDQTLATPTPFTTVGTTDQFRCFVLDPELDADAYVDGVHFAPGNPLVVHHLLLYVDQGGAQSAAMADADGGYDCFGGPGFDSPELMAAWAPGGVPTVFPEGTGMRLQAGARLVMQVHYHPTGADDPQQDTTTVQLSYTDSTPELLALTALLGNFGSQDADTGDGLQVVGDEVTPEFMIPADTTDHVERMRFTVPGTLDGKPFPGMYVHSVASHMHYVGTNMRTTVTRPEKIAACDAAAVSPLQTCMAANCPDAAGEDVVTCATGSCGAEVGALAETCQTCLVGQITVGAADIYAQCLGVATPTQYGALADQPAEECLLETPDWDFAWQRFYTYDAPIEALPFVQAGDVFDFECTFDNSMSNRFVREALAAQGLSEPQDVVLGDETLDEMCLVAITLLYKWPDAQ